MRDGGPNLKYHTRYRYLRRVAQHTVQFYAQKLFFTQTPADACCVWCVVFSLVFPLYVLVLTLRKTYVDYEYSYSLLQFSSS